MLQICLCIAYYIISAIITTTFFWDTWDSPKVEILGVIVGLLFGWIVFPFIACYYIYELFTNDPENNWLNY